jgi:hypothetical protein
LYEDQSRLSPLPIPRNHTHSKIKWQKSFHKRRWQLSLLNLRASASYRFRKEKVGMAVSAFNALNDRHNEDPIGDIIGSRVLGWLTLRF